MPWRERRAQIVAIWRLGLQAGAHGEPWVTSTVRAIARAATRAVTDITRRR